MATPTEIPTMKLTNSEDQKEIEKLLSCLIMNPVQREEIKYVFLEEMRLGLSEKPERPSTLQMENTFIEDLANGTENGSYLALDLGGTNLRTILLTLEDGHVVNEVIDYSDVPESLRMGDGEKLFEYIADCIKKFIEKQKLTEKEYKLGFTFSFPMTQEGINVGILTKWTKTYNASGVEGKNVVGLLNTALKKKNVNAQVSVILNDTTGTLIQGSYMDHRCGIGMIVGTGCNACYIEKVENVKKWKEQKNEREVIIDIEWGAFGDNGNIDKAVKTDWDRIVDEKSLMKNSFTFEKYISGRYLGDIVREVLVTLADKGLAFKKSICKQCLKIHGSFSTKSVATIEGEAFRGQLTYAMDLLKSWGLDNISRDDAKILQYVCALVSYRSVMLVSLLCSVLMERMEKPHCTIAIDGSLFEHHPRFRPLMQHLISLYAPKRSFSLLLARDGSGIGGGLVAAVADRMQKKTLENGI